MYRYMIDIKQFICNIHYKLGAGYQKCLVVKGSDTIRQLPRRSKYCEKWNDTLEKTIMYSQKQNTLYTVNVLLRITSTTYGSQPNNIPIHVIFKGCNFFGFCSDFTVCNIIIFKINFPLSGYIP